jgi:hypothetical protein
MSHHSSLPNQAHLPTTWIPCLRLVLWFPRLPQPTLLFQVPRRLLSCPTRHRCLHTHQAWPRCSHPRHVQPRLHATLSSLGVLAVTSGPRVRSLVYHPVVVACDPRSTHPMVTRRVAQVTKLVDRLQLSTIIAPPTLSPVSICL